MRNNKSLQEQQMRFHLLTEYKPESGDVIYEKEILEEDFKSFLIGLAGLLSPLAGSGQNAFQRAEDMLTSKQDITVNGITYDTPEEKKSMAKGFSTVKQYIGNDKIQNFLKNAGSVDMDNVPPILQDFYKVNKTDPAVRGVFNLSSQVTKGTSWKKPTGSKVELTGDFISQDQTTTNVDEAMRLIKQGYDLTSVEYVEAVQQIEQEAPDTLVAEFKLDSKQLFKENGFKFESSHMQQESDITQTIEKIKSLSKQVIISEVEVVASASEIPTKAFGGSNEKLAEARGCAISGALVQGGIDSSVVTQTTGVSGPEWDSNTQDRSEYHKYQFVTIKVHYIQESLKPISPDKKVTGKYDMTLSKLTPQKIEKGGPGSPGGPDGGGKTKKIKDKSGKCSKF